MSLCFMRELCRHASLSSVGMDGNPENRHPWKAYEFQGRGGAPQYRVGAERLLGASDTWVVAISRKTAGTGSKESHLEWQGPGCLSVASRNPRVMVCLGWECQGPFPPTSSHPSSQLLPSFPQVLALPTELWQGVQPRAACGRRRHSCPQRAGCLPTNQNTGGQSSQWTEFKHNTA